MALLSALPVLCSSVQQLKSGRMGSRSKCALIGKKDTSQLWLSGKCKFAGQCIWYNAIYAKSMFRYVRV